MGFGITPATTSAATSSSQPNWQQWQSVGSAQLSWLVFDVYQSTLHSPSGSYLVNSDISPHALALEIEYQRDVSGQQLLDATQDQWQHLDFAADDQINWSRQLAVIFPDIKKGQRLIYVSDGLQGSFHFDDLASTKTNGEAVVIGKIEDPRLNDAFLSIWLSTKTQYPKLRQQLIGAR
ncbi:hypothetical protein BCU68_01620 [Vibrio sp. 10N.286.49.B3]|nr:hypothetical protein BCU68_01620 [Vibrio sp. 10N.286.49.B3]